MPETDVTKMKVADLKRELKLRGLSSTGNKTELQDRLHTALLEGELSLEDTAISGEDLLDEDAVLTDEEESKILGSDENELLQSPTNKLMTSVGHKVATTLGAGIIDDDDILHNSSAPLISTRKIVLKRKNSFTTNNQSSEITLSAVATENSQLTTVKSAKLNVHTPIVITSEKVDDPEVTRTKVQNKISQLTLQQRMDMRAKKFGLSGASSTPVTPSANIANSGGESQQIDVLKKRAERFGCVVSSKIAKLDAEERLLKRKERFGGGGTTANSNGTKAIPSTSETGVWAEKARLRLERFGATQSASAQNLQAAKN